MYLLYILLIFNFSITPLKSYGLFVPNFLYYSYLDNKNFRDDRNKIKFFANKNIDCKNIFIIYDKKIFLSIFMNIIH